LLIKIFTFFFNHFLDLNIEAMEFNGYISGDGGMKVSGYAAAQSFHISGIGEFKCFELIGVDADIDISGQGDLEVNVSRKLDVNISASGTIKY